MLRRIAHKYRLVAYSRFQKHTATTKQSGNGFLYIAFGRSFSKEALLSIQSLRRFHKERILVFTDHPDLFNDTSLFVEAIAIKPRHLRAKIDYIDRSPFENTIYLDSDTVIVSNISDIFQLLDRFDVAATIDSARKRENLSTKIKQYESIPYAFPEVNGGVLAFNASSQSRKMLKLWRTHFYDKFTETNGWDQPSLRIALWESEVRLACLPPEYNIRSVDLIKKTAESRELFGINHMAPRVYHMHHSPAVHDGIMAVDSVDDLEQIVRHKAIPIEY